MTVKIDLTLSGAKTLVRVLDFVINKANTSSHAMLEVDALCRNDSVHRWRELRNHINARIPKKYRS